MTSEMWLSIRVDKKSNKVRIYSHDFEHKYATHEELEHLCKLVEFPLNTWLEQKCK